MTKIALVTGGTGGLGTAICRQLFDSGYQVIAGYYSGGDHSKAQRWQENMADEGYHIPVVYGDIRRWDSAEALIKSVNKDFGCVDVLVNNGGITRDATLRKMSLQHWEDVIATNLNSVFYMTRLVIEDMVQNRFGRIINISSVNGEKGQFGQSNYAAAKAGMYGFTKSVAQEVASKGVTVNTISPGYVETEMVAGVPTEIRDKLCGSIPVGRLAQPHEIARIVEFLANDEAGFITGSNISANGGQYMN